MVGDGDVVRGWRNDGCSGDRRPEGDGCVGFGNTNPRLMSRRWRTVKDRCQQA